MTQRRCHYCKRKMSDRRKVCGGCQSVQGVYDSEQQRQHQYLAAKWLGSDDNGGAVPPTQRPKCAGAVAAFYEVER